MPRRVERKAETEFSKEAYLKGRKFVPGIDKESAIQEAREIHEKSKRAFNNNPNNTRNRKPIIKGEK